MGLLARFSIAEYVIGAILVLAAVVAVWYVVAPDGLKEVTHTKEAVQKQTTKDDKVQDKKEVKVAKQVEKSTNSSRRAAARVHSTTGDLRPVFLDGVCDASFYRDSEECGSRSSESKGGNRRLFSSTLQRDRANRDAGH